MIGFEILRGPIRFGRRTVAVPGLLLLAAGCGDSGAFGPIDECPERSQAGLVAATSCAPTHGAVEGRVVDAATGEPIVGAVVATTPSTRTALTGSNGGFEIEGILLEEGGTFTEIAVTAARSGYESDSETVALRQDMARVTVELALSRPPEPVVVQGGVVARVLHRGGPFAGAAVEALDPAGDVVETAASDADGFALFSGLDPGTWVIRATATIAGRPFEAVEGVTLPVGADAYVELDLRQVF